MVERDPWDQRTLHKTIHCRVSSVTSLSSASWVLAMPCLSQEPVDSPEFVSLCWYLRRENPQFPSDSQRDTRLPNPFKTTVLVNL